VSRKEFEPLDELLDTRLSVLFVTFCSPVLPIGLVTTLLAWLLETHFKATKLLYIRRRCWPGTAQSLLWTQGVFAHVTVVLAVWWHTGLAMVTYNPNLFEWGICTVSGVWGGATLIVTAVLYVMSWQIRKVWHVARRFIWKQSLSKQPPTGQPSQAAAKSEQLVGEAAAQPTSACQPDRVSL